MPELAGFLDMSRKDLHPSFRKKNVVQLDCKFCGRCVCDRGMRAILLADTAVELFSTDIPPDNAIDLVEETYCTAKCKCRIKNFACLGCGNVIGYAVVQPCRVCLQSCNNGHLWMYHSSGVESCDRIAQDHNGCRVMNWGELLDGDENNEERLLQQQEECIR